MGRARERKMEEIRIAKAVNEGGESKKGNIKETKETNTRMYCL